MARQIQNIVFLLLVLAVPFVSSLAIEQNTNRTLVFYPRVNGAVASNVLCNITVLYPNGSILVDFDTLTDEGDRFTYNLTNDLTSVRGDYSGSVTCLAPSGDNQTEAFDYVVNLSGVDPSQQRTDAMTRTLYFMFGLGILLFISFLFFKQVSVKVTVLLLSLMFLLIGVNIIFITLQDEIVSPKLVTFFSFFTSVSFILYWFIGMLIGIIWIITFFVTIFQGMESTKEARNLG